MARQQSFFIGTDSAIPKQQPGRNDSKKIRAVLLLPVAVAFFLHAKNHSERRHFARLLAVP
jgi:hypothetical protein